MDWLGLSLYNNQCISSVQDESKQMKRYDKYKPSGIEWIGEIPQHWELKKIEICYLFKSKSWLAWIKSR